MRSFVPHHLGLRSILRTYQRKVSRHHKHAPGMKWAPKSGPRTKMYDGEIHQACGRAERWSKNGGETRQPASLDWRCEAAEQSGIVSTIEHRLKGGSCSDLTRPHSPNCTLFSPFRGLTIGANRSRSLAPKSGPLAKVNIVAVRQPEERRFWPAFAGDTRQPAGLELSWQQAHRSESPLVARRQKTASFSVQSRPRPFGCAISFPP